MRNLLVPLAPDPATGVDDDARGLHLLVGRHPLPDHVGQTRDQPVVEARVVSWRLVAVVVDQGSGLREALLDGGRSLYQNGSNGTWDSQGTLKDRHAC